jgi:hypothetical protein
VKLERARPSVLRLTLHAYELAALIAAVRWTVEKGEGELPEESVEELRRMLASYDEATRRADAPGSSFE